MKASKFTFSTIVLLLLSVGGWASDKMKENIGIHETVQVGSTQLTPGTYRMTWTENGSNAEVTFAQGRKVIATVQAQITEERSGYSNPALITDIASNTLTGVLLPKESLSFTGKDASPAKSGN